jgi:hypothetical protein
MPIDGGGSGCSVPCVAPATCGGGGIANACGYSTSFAGPSVEQPIRQGSIWRNGQADGVLWSDVNAGKGRAFGAPTNMSGGTNGQYADPTAILTGTWSASQRVTATASCLNNVSDKITYPEVELRLRFSLSAHSATGYEISWRCADSNNPNSLNSSYVLVARWNGGLGDFTLLVGTIAGGGVVDGDTVSAEMIGNTLTFYRNGMPQGTVTDSTFATGNPGIGFNYVAADDFASGAPNVNFGFTHFVATEIPGF